jgi:uncharacterized protein YjdB
METKRRLFGLIAIVAIIVLLATACDSGLDLPDDTEGPGGGGNVTNGKAVYTSVDSEGNTYELTIIPKSDKAAYDPQAGDSYTLTIYYLDGTTKTSVGTITHKVKSGSTTTATLSVSETSFTVTLKTVSEGFSVMTEIKGEIPITDDDTKSTIAIQLTLNPKEDNSGNNVDIPVTSVTLSKSSLYLKVGEDETLVAPILPFNATNKDVVWSSSNTAVATVSSNGEITAVAPGSAVITVTTVDGGFTASCEVIVTGEGEYVPITSDGNVAVTGINLNKKEINILEGDSSEALIVIVIPNDATNQNVEWSSSDTDVATVSIGGVVTGVSSGKATITATTIDGGYAANCSVTVGPKFPNEILLNKSTMTILVYDTETLTASITPPNAVYNKVTWSSSNTSVATVSSEGAVKGVSAGEAIVTATTQNGITATCKITVKELIFTSISDFGKWLSSASENTVDVPYYVKLNVSSLTGITDIMTNFPQKYVYIDLSGSTITAIPEGAFYFCHNLAGIIMPNSVTSIGKVAFVACNSLASVIIPDSVTSIGESAFYHCSSLASVTIGKGVTSIASQALKFCNSLVSVTIPDSVTSIESMAFDGCTSLASINIPSNITNIHGTAFGGCASLTSINVPGNSIYTSENGILYTNDKKTLIAYPSAKGSYTMPDTITSIGTGAFWRCNGITSLTIGKGVTSIGASAFYYSGLTSITIPDTVTNIEQDAFSHSTSLASVIIGSGVTSIESWTFFNCTSLTSVTIGSGVTKIAGRAFDNCNSLISVEFKGTIPSSGFNTQLNTFPGDLRDKFYTTDPDNGTPGTYTRASGSDTWTFQ